MSKSEEHIKQECKLEKKYCLGKRRLQLWLSHCKTGDGGDDEQITSKGFSRSKAPKDVLATWELPA